MWARGDRPCGWTGIDACRALVSGGASDRRGVAPEHRQVDIAERNAAYYEWYGPFTAVQRSLLPAHCAPREWWSPPVPFRHLDS